ncbi:glucosyltransferase domain-containing protein, partial [Campylobacter fetus]|nr:glucosyltransferase domain-containing protein [Campylobacter fetus]
FGLYFTGYFALIVNNVNYGDDYHRATYGDFGFQIWSRFSSEFLSKIFHISLNRNVEISPLLQIIAIAILSIGSMILVKTILKKYNFWGLAASLPLGLSPFFLENMSFKFDSVFMAISLVSPIIPFLFLKNKIAFFIISILCLELTLTTYQTGNAVYIMLSLFIILSYILEGKDYKQIIKCAMLLILAYISSLLIYKFFILNESSGEWYASKSTFELNNLIPGVSKNLKTVLKIYEDVFKHTIFVPIFALGIIGFLFACIKVSKICRFWTLIASLGFIISGILLSYGAYLVLEKQIFSDRTFNGIGMFLAIIFVFLFKIDIKIYKFFSKTICFILAYSLIIEATAWANVLKEQTEYAKYRVEIMLHDFYKMIPKDNKFGFTSEVNKNNFMSPIALNTSKTFPIIMRNHAIDNMLDANWLFNSYGLMAHYEHWTPILSKGLCGQKNKKPIEIVENPLHKITKYDNNCFVIEFL